MKQLWEFDCYRVDCERRLLLRGEEPVQLPAKALDILLVLVQRRGEVVTKDELMKAVWPDAFVEEGNLSQSIHVLRRTLGESVEDHRYIVTVPGRGYRFVAEVREISETDKSPFPKPVPTPYAQTWAEKLLLWFRANPKFLKFLRRWTLPLAITGLFLALALVKSLPSIARTYNNRGFQLQQSGEIKAAIEDYRRAIRLNPGYAEAHYNLADAYEEIPDYDKALEEYQKAINANFKFYQAYNNLSRLYILRRRDYGAALRLLDRAMNLKPQEPSVQYSLHKNYGWANFELRQLGQAEQNLKFAVAVNSDRGAAHCLLAKVLDVREKAAVALAEWEACAAYSSQEEVEPEWRNEAQERLRKETAK
jgi:DNA-binding winged helix-turn-helix (wHTH) protein/Tfp pilus assembly protein PilF